MRRRWKAGESGVVRDKAGHGIRWRVVLGGKFPEDLVIELHTPTGWFRPPFELAFLLDDFYAENERLRYLSGSVPHWQTPGDEYYAKRVMRAITDGYQAPTEETRRDRRATEASVQSSTVGRVPDSGRHNGGPVYTLTAADFDGLEF